MIPHNKEAERHLLSSFVAGGSSSFEEVATLVDEKDFYDHQNQIIFRSIKNVVLSGNELDEISLSEELKKEGLLEEAGGLSNVLSATGYAGSIQNRYCAETVKEKSNLRKLIKKFKSCVEEMQEETKSSKDITSDVEGLLIEVSGSSGKKEGMKESLEEIQIEFQSMLDGTYDPQVIKTNISHLDDKLNEGGIGIGEVMVIAAPTSCGKSQLALNIASRAINRQNQSCMIFSLEMPKKQVLKRMLHSMSGINPRRIREGRITTQEEEKIRECSARLEEMSLYSSHSVRDVDDLAIQCRSAVRKYGVKLVVVDYLQLVPWDAKKFSKTEAVSDISHKIKQMAIELDISVILLSQVNREGSRSEGGLEVYHLRDSGDIENDADVIIMMYPEGMCMNRATRVDSEGEYKNMIYKIGKNREGERDLMGLFKFYNHYGRFY